jgi:hypothetical protein
MTTDSHVQSTRPPQVAAMQLNLAYQVTRAVHAATELGVPDLLAKGARTFIEISQAAGTQADRMHRLLRVLAAIDVVRDLGSGRFELTPVGDCLRTDARHSVRPLMLLGRESIWPAFESLADCVRTGKNHFEIRHGVEGPFAFLARHPEQARIFNDAMSALSAATGSAVANAYDFAGMKCVVDVGGGHGIVFASILKAHPHLRGILLDVPSVVEGALPLLTREGVSNRCEVVGGDMFARVPAGGDVYLLSHIVHDWDDEPREPDLARLPQRHGAAGKATHCRSRPARARGAQSEGCRRSAVRPRDDGVDRWPRADGQRPSGPARRGGPAAGARHLHADTGRPRRGGTDVKASLSSEGALAVEGGRYGT